MFVRFRQSGHRLQVSLAESRRVDGRVRHDHVASFGSVIEPPSVAERIDFWQRLNERFAKLSNRIDAAMQGKILGEVHARIPMVTVEEQRALQLENAQADEKLWAGLHDISQGLVDGHKALKARVDQTIATNEAAAADAAVNVAAAKDRIERIKRGENVQGGLGKQVDIEQMLRNTGWTTKEINDATLLAALPEEAIKHIAEVELKAGERASKAAVRRLARKMLPNG
jgi:hypothetical protein